MSRFFVVNSIFIAALMMASSARGAECTIDRDVLIPGASCPRFRDDVAHHSEMISPTVPR